MEVELRPLEAADTEQFITDNQRAFDYGAMEEFGLRDDHCEEEGHIISRATIAASIESGQAFRIVAEGQVVGGLVVQVDGERGELDLLFTNPGAHSKGIGYAAWCEVERTFPQVKVWRTHTPYFEKRNIHFYVNRCGFSIIEFFHERHPDPHGAPEHDAAGHEGDGGPDEMFLFEKRIRKVN